MPDDRIRLGSARAILPLTCDVERKLQAETMQGEAPMDVVYVGQTLITTGT